MSTLQPTPLPRDEELLARVPADGRAIANSTLLNALGWAADEYWEIRNRLVDKGTIAVGRGRGGTVRLVLPGAAGSADEMPVQARAARSSESELYRPLTQVLAEQWVKDKRVESAIVQITALQGSRSTGGKWTRPDITVATLSTYPYVPGRHFDVVSFEVKPRDALDVTSVYEALAHLRAATKAYVLMHVEPDQLDNDRDDIMIEVAAEAKKHGVGLILFSNPADYETWDERIEPVRREPEPRRLNDFLATQFEAEQLERIVKWFR